MIDNKYFPDLIGQHAVKKKLSFYLEAFAKTKVCPFLLLLGAKGLGKTEFAKAFAKNLYNDDGDRRTFLEPMTLRWHFLLFSIRRKPLVRTLSGMSKPLSLILSAKPLSLLPPKAIKSFPHLRID